METNTLNIESLYKSLSQKLRQFIRNRIADGAAADDILQDVFLRIHDRIETLRDREKIESWVFQIARNAIIDHYRSRKPDHEEPPEAIAVEEDDQAMHKKLASGLGAMIDQLPEQYREALRLTELQGLTQKELAERLGISLSGAKSRVQRARALLRDLLMQCCHFEFDRYGMVIDYHPISCRCCQESTSP
jgi:RNA polymerase sigma-70 factor (ECF subfamily)